MPSPELPSVAPSGGIRYARSLTAADVGRRVVVRHRLDTLPEAGPGAATGTAAGSRRLTDALGVLTSWVDGALTVRRRDGSTVTVQESAVVAAKVVPDLAP